MTDFEIIATVNSHLLDQMTLETLATAGATIFRINGAHVQAREVPKYVGAIRRHLGGRVKILVDLPGNKVRTTVLSEPIRVRAGGLFHLYPDQLNYPKFLAMLKPGDTISANDSLLKFEVLQASNEKATLKSYSDGLLGSNKGFHLRDGYRSLPFFFEKDLDLIQESIRSGVDFLGLSFVRSDDDVRTAKEIVDGRSELIIKVETKSALENLDSIVSLGDRFLLDRGDLSADIGIEKIHYYQDHVIGKIKARGKKIMLATQFLLSMTTRNVASIAEICGLSDALRKGIDGLQLSEETAEGKFPVEAIQTVQRVREFIKGRLRPLRFGQQCVIWLTGRSGSGKTTLAERVRSEVQAAGYSCAVIDGDEFRAFWGDEIGYSRDERIRNQRSIIFAAYQAAKIYDVVLVASLSPYREMRSLARQKIDNFHEVFLACSTEACARRDPKGHYRNPTLRDRQDFVHVAEHYEEPEAANLVINTEKDSVAMSVERLTGYLFS